MSYTSDSFCCSEGMKSDTPLDYAVFQLSPKRSRCELLVSSDGNTEKLASGLVKPFVTHLKVAEEQVALAVQSIKLEVDRHNNAETWFTKGTLERFVRFVSMPEVLEKINTFDTEMSQLEAARRIYSQGAGDQQGDSQGGDGAGTTAAADATKKELARAIDVRLAAVGQHLATACAHALAVGYNPDTVSELQHFAERFGAHHLNEVCTKISSLYQRKPDLISLWEPGGYERDIRSSVGSDMSIDDPTEDQSGSHVAKQSKFSARQHPKRFATFGSGISSNGNDKDDDKNEAKHSVVNEKETKEEAPSESSPSPPLSTPADTPARRLSVQDRINLFENKQKENSGGSGGISKPSVAKSVELKRLSSDLSAAPAAVAVEKSFLKRWSGASDMSIDVSGEKKDSESHLCTPSSVSTVSQTKSNVASEDKDQRVLNNSETSINAVPQSGGRGYGDVGLKDQTDTQNCFGVSAAKDEADESNLTTNWKNQATSATKLRSFMGRPVQVVKSDQGFSQETSKVSIFDEVRTVGYKDQMVSAAQLKGSDRTEIASKSQIAPQMDVGIGTATVGEVTSDVRVSRREDVGMRNRLVAQSLLKPSHSHSRSLSGQFEGGTGLTFNEASSVKVGGDQSPNQPQWGSYAGEAEDYVKKESTFSSKQQIKVKDSEVPRMKYQKPRPSSREQISKSQSKRIETRAAFENSKLNFTGKEVVESQDGVDLASVTPLEQVHRVRQSKGNQGLNDDLKMKANELEKLFAEHKLRVPGDQSGSALRSESADTHVEQTVNLQYRRPEALQSTPHMPARKIVLEQTGSSGNAANFGAKSINMVEDYNSGDALGPSFSGLNSCDNSRGRFYEKYMQKRDAKLREEWSSNRAEKEARMKAMEDSLEQSRAEMKTKFSASTNRLDSLSGTQHAEKLRSFNLQSNIKKDQHPISSLQNEGDEDLSEFSEEKIYGAPSQSRKNLLNRNTSSTIPRTTAISVPRSSAKVSNSTSGRRRDSPLAQSVPNFSDLRKENTKPSSGVGKTTRSQGRNHSRSKSTIEEMGGIKEEKSKQPQSLWKNSANPSESKNMSPLNSDGVVLSPLKFDREQTGLGSYDQSFRSSLRKGLGTSVGASTFGMKDSMASEAQNNEEFDELGFEEEDVLDMAKEEEDKTETLSIEDCTHNGKVRPSQESEKSGNSGSQIGDPTRSLAQGDPVSVAEMPTAIPSAFNSVRSRQDSPIESPISWNSRLCHSLSYPNESSDVDASVDSPIGSPASWNSQSLTRPETDAARMRKKWGSAQKPTLVANASHNQSRKDVTKGFKRLLKFGRKSRGSESLADWISATTSEGDDDTEDGRDSFNQSSEDLRRSRMGYSQGHPSDDSFNESELFSEQVQSLQSSIPPPPDHFKLRDDHISGSSIKAPRSFFSLSSFRSKGSDIKLR